jgi:integrase
MLGGGLRPFLTVRSGTKLSRHHVSSGRTFIKAARWRCSCFLFFWQSLRALRWADVRFSDGYLYVCRNHPVHGIEGETKSGKPRSVPLWDQAAMPLAKLRDREHFSSDEDYVFCQATGEPLGYDWTTRRFKTARDAAQLASPRAGDEPLTFHDLRHTYGTLAAAL